MRKWRNLMMLLLLLLDLFGEQNGCAIRDHTATAAVVGVLPYFLN